MRVFFETKLTELHRRQKKKKGLARLVSGLWWSWRRKEKKDSSGKTRKSDLMLPLRR